MTEKFVSKVRNAAAISLRSGLFRKKVVKSEKVYSRKNNQKELDKLI